MARKILSSEEKEKRERKKEAVALANEKIFNILFVEDELSWKDVIYSLIDQEQMDPWDIDLTIIAQKFLEMLRKLKELDFRISGKMVLAAAILLKMKSDRLVDQDIAHFDSMMTAAEENLPLDESTGSNRILLDGRPEIYPRTPQPRKRKVSIFDLVKALEKALEVESRRKKLYKPNAKKITLHIPEKRRDLGKSMDEIYGRIEKHYKDKKTKEHALTFDQLVTSYSKRDKVLTFIPLLHLDTFRRVDLEQEKHFESIAIKLAKQLTREDYEELKRLMQEEQRAEDARLQAQLAGKTATIVEATPSSPVTSQSTSDSAPSLPVSEPVAPIASVEPIPLVPEVTPEVKKPSRVSKKK
ncbi:MAG: segregation/condensation protein A [Candidatus Woesearchaeota archaeon]